MKTFEWHHAADLETLCVVGESIGFFQAVPGHPFEVSEPTRPGQPPCDLMLRIADLGAKVRYRLGPRPSGPDDPRLLAQTLAYTYPKARSPEPREPRTAPPEQLARFGADAAASILYPLREGTERGLDTEETLALVKGDRIVVITKTFARATTDPVAWALFNHASTQSIVWDAARRPRVASVWPPGTFLAPGVKGTPLPEARAALRAALDASTAGPDERRALADALRRMFGGSEPLAEAITADMKATFADALKASCNDRALWATIDGGLALVSNAYDLHGFAITLWRELR